MTQGRSDDDLHTVDLARELVRRMDRDPEYVYRVLAEVRDARIAAEARAVAAEAQVAQLRQVALRDGHVITEQGRQLAAAQAKIAAADRVAREADDAKRDIDVAEFYEAVLTAGVAPDKPAPTECNDERCVLPGAHDLGEFGCLVDPGVAPDQPNGDKR